MGLVYHLKQFTFKHSLASIVLVIYRGVLQKNTCFDWNFPSQNRYYKLKFYVINLCL
jgi:hypothetical protein